MVQNNRTWYDALWGLLKKAWSFLEKIVIAIFRFFEHLVNWVKAKYLEVYRKHPTAIPIALKIKEQLDSGNYATINIGLKESIVNTFYDEATGNILKDYTKVISYSSLDEETKNRFGNDDMLVLT